MSKIVKGIDKKFTGKQKDRVKNIINLIKPTLKKIKADHLCTLANAHKILRLSIELSQTHLNLSKSYEFNPLLKRFGSQKEWYLLHLVNIYSARGDKCYKEKLAQHPLLINKASYKTIYKVIDELVAEGLFIEMPEHTSDGINNGYKNIRPSEELAGAYFQANVEHLVDNLKFLKENTKLTIGDIE